MKSQHGGREEGSPGIKPEEVLDTWKMSAGQGMGPKRELNTFEKAETMGYLWERHGNNLRIRVQHREGSP